MMNYIGGPFIGPEPHHHHHGPSPVELAQISGASQYARLNTRLQKHIEDDVRHITDEERYKWNKGIYDLKALKEDINDGTIGGGGLDKDELALYLTTHKYATQDWVEGKGYQTESQVNWLITTWFLTKFGITDFGKLAKLSDLEGYVKKGSLLGSINGQPFYEGGSINTAGNNGLIWDDIIRGIYWDGNYSTGTLLGYFVVNNNSTPIYAPKGQGEVGSTVSFQQANMSGWDRNARYEIGTITIDGESKTIYGKDSWSEGDGGGGGSVVKWTDMYFTLYNSNTEAPEPPQSVNNTFVSTSVNGQRWTDNPQNPANGQYVWCCWVTFSKNGNILTCGPEDISDPICVSGVNGINGEDGVSTEFIYHVASKPLEEFNASGWNNNANDPWGLNDIYGHIGGTGDGVINGLNGVYPDDFVPNAWTDDPTGISEDFPYEYVAIRTCAIDANGKRTWENRPFHGPLLWSKWGQDGLDGPGIEFIFSEPILVGTSSTDLDNWLTATLNRMYSATGADKNYKDKQAYQDAQEVGPSLESYNGYSGSEKHWSDEPGSYEGYGPGYAIFASVRRLIYDQQEDKMKWSAFSVPQVWSNWANDGLPGPALGHYYNLTASPAIIKKTADGKFILGQGAQITYENTINVTVELTETQVENSQETTTKVWPTTGDGGNGYKLFKSVNGGAPVRIQNNEFDATDHTYSFEVNDSISQVSFVWRSSTDALLAEATVVVWVDGSVYSGMDGLYVEMLNDSWNVGCDSTNLIMALNESSTIEVYEGSQKLQINSLTFANSAVQNGQSARTITCGFSGGSVTANVSISDTIVNIQSSSYNAYMSNPSVSIPIVLNVTRSNGQSGQCRTALKLTRVNSGAPGVAPLMYKLNLTGDVISIDKNNGYSPSTITGFILKYKNGSWTNIDSSDSDLYLQIFDNQNNVTNPSDTVFHNAIQFTGTSVGTFTLNKTCQQLNSKFGRWFTIGLCLDDMRCDVETVQFVYDGKDGNAGSQGLQGCVVRTSLLQDGLQVPNTTYRNDENLTFASSQTAVTRYIDIVAVADSTATGGYRWYKVKPASSGSRVIRASASTSYTKNVNTSTSTAYAQSLLSSAPTSATADFEYLSDVGAIYASFILADYAKIKFTTGNELTIVDSNNNPVAGITGGGNVSGIDSAVRIWAGNGADWDGTPWEDGIDIADAAFKVYEDGSLEATKATITGNIFASNKHIYLGECTEGPQWVSEDYRTQGIDVIAIKDGNNDGTSIVIGSDPSDSGAINLINKDGSGHFANRNIKWNRVGNFQLGEIPTGSSNANAIELNQYAGAISVQSKLRDDGTGLRYTRTDIDRTGITYTATGQKNGVVQASDVELFHVQGDCTSDGIPTLNRGYGISVVGQLAANSQPKQYSGYSGTVNVGNVTLYFVNGLFVGTSDTGADPRSKQWLPDSLWDD